MQITVDTAVDSPEAIRNVCGLLLATIGDIGPTDEELARAAATHVSAAAASAVAAAMSKTPPPPPPGIPAPPIGPGASSAPTAVGAPPAVPASTGTVVTFPSNIPPPPAAFPSATAGAAAAPPAIGGTSAAPSAAGAASPTEVDKAGLPWDARIHQSGRSRKKDGTWKIKKNCDPNLVQQVVKELTERKLGVTVDVEIPAAQVSLPLPASGVPVPPITTGAAAAALSVAGAPTPVPVSADAAARAVPQPAVGPTFRDLVNKFTQATTSGKIQPQEVATLCQQGGAPNLMSLAATPDLIARVDALLDARLLG